MKYCCDLMTECIKDPRIPRCGATLPRPLNKEYYSIFYDELHLEESPNLLDTPGLPEEFKSDEWWKKRGL